MSLLNLPEPSLLKGKDVGLPQKCPIDHNHKYGIAESSEYIPSDNDPFELLRVNVTLNSYMYYDHERTCISSSRKCHVI